MQKTLTIETKESKEVINITDKVSNLIERVDEGICLIFGLHTTCSVMLGEYEPGLDEDFLNMFEQLKPKGPFIHAHNPDHAPSHLFSSMVGEQVSIPIKKGSLVLGTWQRVMLVEFDGPRSRNIVIQTFKSQ
ncbi:YjbQ family protein [Patescibacteria group bacterium]|nr:YjbQ family protein [Patescibacteria group bacterium]